MTSLSKRSTLTLPIQAGRTWLRAYRESDAEATLAYQGDPEALRFVPWEPWTRETAVKRVADRCTRTSITGPDSILSLVVEYGGQVVGDVVLWPTDPSLSKGEVGWIMHPTYQGLGLAAEAAKGLLNIAFHVYGMHRVIAEVDPRNHASRALCKRVGMSEEGILRQHSWVKGEWADTVVYSVLAADRRGAERRA
jgi:aminoglycoside 6'-N-acetyltransferase